MRLAVIAALAIVCAARPARAQCGAEPSTCSGCHAADDAPWHRDHAFADLCAGCHGGDPEATDIDAAHLGRIDPRASCSTCHDDVAAYPAVSAAPPIAPPPPPAVSGRPPHDGFLAIAIVAVAIAAIAVFTRRRGLAHLARPFWSPYLAGALLGAVVTISVSGFGRRLSGAGGYQSLSGYVGARLAPHDVYWTSIVHTGMTWDVWILVGTFAGAFLSALAGRQLRVRTMPDARWIEAFGPRVAVRWLLVFAGTAALSFAAGLAGGCTASLVLSGGALLAPGAYVFMAAMFAGGIPVARLVMRGGRR